MMTRRSHISCPIASRNFSDTRHIRRRIFASVALCGLLLSCVLTAIAGDVRHLKLEEAVRLAIQQNRTLRLARLKVKENEAKKSEARSDYFPVITNQSNALHITELQNIVVPAGALGAAGGSLIPPVTATVEQGNRNLYSSGTMIAQPLTQLLRVHAENRAAAAEVATSREDVRNAEDEVAVQVHNLYFGILIAQLQKKAAEQQTSFASESLRENENNVLHGSALHVAEIQNKADVLQGEQATLTADLQIADYTTALNDLLGLPLDTKLELDTDVPADFQAITKAEYVQEAWSKNPEIRSAEQTVEKARAGVSAAKTAYIPDVTAFARYSYQDGVPFFVRNFGTVGINLNYTLWDFGKRRAKVEERSTQLAEAEQNLERLKDDVAVKVEQSYNKLDRTKHMVEVATKVVELREESERLTSDQQARGIVLISDVRHASAANYQAKADLLQAQLGYLLAYAELERTVGRVAGLGAP
jgi:outer membrane protein TolC